MALDTTRGFSTGGGTYAAIGPAEFGIQRRGECDDGNSDGDGDGNGDGDGECDGDGDRTGTTSGLLKFNKGIKRPRTIHRIDAVTGRTNARRLLLLAAEID